MKTRESVTMSTQLNYMPYGKVKSRTWGVTIKMKFKGKRGWRLRNHLTKQLKEQHFSYPETNTWESGELKPEDVRKSLDNVLKLFESPALTVPKVKGTWLADIDNLCIEINKE